MEGEKDKYSLLLLLFVDIYLSQLAGITLLFCEIVTPFSNPTLPIAHELVKKKSPKASCNWVIMVMKGNIYYIYYMFYPNRQE